MATNSCSKGCKIAAVFLLLLVVIIVAVILLAKSVVTLEYYEYGFVKWHSTGRVNTDLVYKEGHYFLGPDTGFKVFPRYGKFQKLHRVDIATSEKLEVQVTVTYQYFLREEALVFLHKEYDLYYEPVFKSNAIAALKNAAVVFTTREYLQQRRLVEETLRNAVTQKLGGICCGHRDCKRNYCIDGCKPYDECQESDMGLFAIVRHFQLTEVIVPEDVEDRFVRAMLLLEETKTAQLQQESAVIDKETDRLVEEINNEAREIARNATANADLIVSRAQANATAKIEQARAEGLRRLYTKLDLQEEEHKHSFDYLRSIKQMDNAHLTVNFENAFIQLQSRG